jgi:hypothetical protein
LTKRTAPPCLTRSNPLQPLIILLLFLVFQGQGRACAQNTLDKLGLGAGAPAAAAYSSRLLSSSYAGKALRVLRTSDNTQSDIGFTAGGDLDTAALKTFVGAANAQVTTWYDQSGNGLDLTQATQTAQPILVSSGVINRENGQPFIRFYGSGTAYNSLNLATAMNTVGHVSAVIRLMSGGDGFILSYTNGYNWHSNPPSYLINNTYASASVQGGNAWFNAAAVAPDLTPWPSTLSVAEIEPSTPSTSTTWDNIGSDRNQYHDISLGGGYGELVVFPTALSTADRLTLEANESAYFTGIALPVTWLSFTAQPENGTVLLRWQTATETNSKDFIVQYGTNGETWTALATLPAAGNSTDTRSYSYIHTAPQPGNNYYRLQQTDLDGNSSYSDIQVVQVAAPQSGFQILQNPVTGGLLQAKVNTPMTLSVYSMDGKLLQSGQYNVGTAEIRLDGYSKGGYLLTGHAAGQTTTVKFVLQ